MTAIALETTSIDVPEALRRNWRAWLVLAAMAALFAVDRGGDRQRVRSRRGPSSTSRAGRRRSPACRAAVPATSATQLRQIAPESAIAINAAIPIAGLANPAARPFLLGGSGAADRLRSLDCLTAAIYYEAATEPTDGQRAVAQVVLNRVRHPAYPTTVCGVVFEGARRSTGCQFSFTCDGSLRRGADGRSIGSGRARSPRRR